MQTGRVRCSRCGWEGKPGDRICGGCGQALYLSDPSYGTPPDYTPTVASPGQLAPPPLPPATRTSTWAMPEAPALPYTAGTPTVAATHRVAQPYRAPTSGRAASSSHGCLRRTVLALAIATVLLVVLLACGWSAVIRPALHTAFDQHLRSAMTDQIDKIPVLPDGFPAITSTIPESVFNLQASTSNNNGDLKDVHFRLQPGVITMSYQLWGRPGIIRTHLAARHGRVFVQGTQVTGWLTQVENGSELQDAMNESLAQIPAQDYVESVILRDGTLTVTLRHA